MSMQSELRRLEIVHWQIIRTESTILKLSFSIYIPCPLSLSRLLALRVYLTQSNDSFVGIKYEEQHRECVSEKDHRKCEKLFSFFSLSFMYKSFLKRILTQLNSTPFHLFFCYQPHLYLCIILCVFECVSTLPATIASTIATN